MPEIPFAHQWTIDENELLALKDSVDGYLFSTPVTTIPEFEYFLKIYPNGHNDQYRGETFIFLRLEFKNAKKVEAERTFTVESANYSHTSQLIYKRSNGWGLRLCSTEEFFDPEKKFIVDGKFTVKLNGIFKYETGNVYPVVLQEQKWCGGELGDELWKKEDTKDFTIITADEKEIKLHKFILENRSEVFTAMFNSNMKESIENKVTIPDFSFNIVETGIKLIYICNFTTKLSMEELMQLLQFFDKYQLSSLKVKVEPYLITQISPSNVVRLTNYSIFTNSIKLKEKCMEFLLNSFKQQTALADIQILDNDVKSKIIEDSLYRTLVTEK